MYDITFFNVHSSYLRKNITKTVFFIQLKNTRYFITCSPLWFPRIDFRTVFCLSIRFFVTTCYRKMVWEVLIQTKYLFWKSEDHWMPALLIPILLTLFPCNHLLLDGGLRSWAYIFVVKLCILKYLCMRRGNLNSYCVLNVISSKLCQLLTICRNYFPYFTKTISSKSLYMQLLFHFISEFFRTLHACFLSYENLQWIW